MNYADIKTVDVQDGTGVRVSIYVSGCHFQQGNLMLRIAIWATHYSQEKKK